MRIFGKQLGVLGLSLALIVGVFSMPASAHFMWVNVGDYTPAVDSRPLKVTLGWGHAFASPVGNVLYKQKGLDKIFMLDPNGKRLRIEPINEIEFKVERPLKKEGTYLVLAEKKGFRSKTTKGGKNKSKKELQNVIHCKKRIQNAKAIVDVGKGGGKIFSRPVGHTLEIVPLKDPAGLRGGGYLPVKVLYNSEPLRIELYASYVGFSTEGAWAYTTKTNKEGIGRIKMLKSGIWLIKASHIEPYPDPEECDEYLYEATLTFEIK